jgi:hypothetical protein
MTRRMRLDHTGADVSPKPRITCSRARPYASSASARSLVRPWQQLADAKRPGRVADHLLPRPPTPTPSPPPSASRRRPAPPSRSAPTPAPDSARSDALAPPRPPALARSPPPSSTPECCPLAPTTKIPPRPRRRDRHPRPHAQATRRHLRPLDPPPLRSRTTPVISTAPPSRVMSIPRVSCPGRNATVPRRASPSPRV